MANVGMQITSWMLAAGTTTAVPLLAKNAVIVRPFC